MKEPISLLGRAYREGWIKERKLHLIWRAIARRWRDADLRKVVINYHNGDAYDGGK
jgi:hypothetical protein